VTDEDTRVPPSYWRIILSDWYNAGAWVTITLRSGVQLTGQVDGHPGSWRVEPCAFRLVADNGRKKISGELAEVAAITASAM